MKEIKRINVWSLIKIQTIITFIIGFLIGVLMLIMPAIPGENNQLRDLGPVLLIAAPIFYSIIGFFSALIIALFYNIIAKWVGGIKIELEDHKR